MSIYKLNFEKKSWRQKIFLYISLFYVAYTFLPIISDIIIIPVWFPSLICSIVLVLLYPKAILNKTMICFITYIFFLTLYAFFNREITIGIGNINNWKKILIEIAFILPSLCIYSVFNYSNDKKIFVLFIFFSLIVIFISFITIIPIMMKYSSVRNALVIYIDKDIKIKGLPSYVLMHSYVLLLPVFTYAIKISKAYKQKISIVYMIILCYVIYDTYITTCLISMICVILLSLLFNYQKSIFVISVILMVIFLLVIYELGYFINIIDYIMPLFRDTSVEGKLSDFRTSLLLGTLSGGTIVTRQSLHNISWQAFLSNPILGNSNVGGHSSIIDRLGGMGLVVFIPYIMIFFSLIFKYIKIYKTSMARYFLFCGIFISCILLYEKNIWQDSCWLIFIVLMPLGIWYFESVYYNNSQNITIE